MKRIIVLLSMVLFLTGCSMVKIDNQDVDTIIDMVFRTETKRYNTVFEGYKYYLPRGFQLSQKTDYNAKLTYERQNYYLYVDVISYYHQVSEKFEADPNAYYSKPLNNGTKVGYLEINEVEDRYFVEAMYHYAKIETYVPKDKLNDALIQIGQILLSVQFNDAVLDTLVGENVLSYKEETFSILKPKRDSKSFLDYQEEYDVYYDKNNEMPDEDKITTENEE